MKKALSFAVALGLVAGAAHVASAADLTITGDTRLRGVYLNNADFNDKVQDREQKMDQRYRLNADVKVNDDVTINTRLVLGNQDFSDAQGAFQPKFDIADMSIKALGGTWTIGRQDVNWGNAPLPFLIKDVPQDWILGAYKVGDITLGGYLNKALEGNAKNGDGDVNVWGALAVGKAGETTWGVLLNYAKSDKNDSTAGDTGFLVDPYFATKIGPATVLGEIAYLGGDLLNKNDAAQYGGYVAGVVALDPLTLTGLIAYSHNGYVADTHFAPSLLIGSTQDTAIIDFGMTSDTGHDDDSSLLLGAVANYKVSDKFSCGALLGYLSASKYAGNGNETGSLVEVDLTAEYELAKNAKYKIGVGYGMPDKLSAADDTLMVVGNAVEVKW